MVEISKETMVGVMSAAIEGGIGYWACIDNTTEEWNKAKSMVRKAKGGSCTLEDVMVQVLENGDYVMLDDVESRDRYRLSMELFLNGIEIWCKHRNIRNFERWWNDGGDSDFDANDGDIVIQYAVFGEIMFG